MFHGTMDLNTAKGLEEMRKRIEKAKIPPSSLDETINIATWNIRAFGQKRRRKKSLHYIAEILNQFDLIAIVELRRNLAELKTVMDMLGPYWKVVYSDYTPDSGGNWERMAYLFDKRAVAFTGLASEADPPRKKNKTTGEWILEFTWWRSPFIASFCAGNFDFVLITAHIRWGDKKSDRIVELKLLANWVEKRRKDSLGVDRDIILMGDFNVPENDPDPALIEPERIETVDTINFMKNVKNGLSHLNGIVLSGDSIDSIKCYLTGDKQPDGSYAINRYRVGDKHGFKRTVFNAKINIYRPHAGPIFLGVQNDALAGFNGAYREDQH